MVASRRACSSSFLGGKNSNEKVGPSPSRSAIRATTAQFRDCPAPCYCPAMEPLMKPRLRGWSHAIGAVFALVGAAALVLASREQPAKAVTMAIYGLSLILLLGMSAVYHIGTWRPRVRAILRGVDHANIFLFIAASYTAVVFNAVTGYWRGGGPGSISRLAPVAMGALPPALRRPPLALS